MNDHDDSGAATITRQVGDFYDRHPYPPPTDDLAGYRELWDDRRRRADSFLFWPGERYRDDRSILVAGCGTTQAAKYALRWPNARVTGIDISVASIDFTRKLKRKYALDNLEVRQLAVERAPELGTSFDHVACTGVLHHLPDPDAGLRALRDVLAPAGALHLMVYAPFGRAGVYLLQDYCRQLGIGSSAAEIRDLAVALRALPPDHPLASALRHAPDFREAAGLADALLHPQDRAYSVPQLMAFLSSSGMAFGRWVRQAPYLPSCGAIAATPHRSLLDRLPPEAQFAAVELFRGTMVRHGLVAYRADRAPSTPEVSFDGDAWLDYAPVRAPDTIAVTDSRRPGAIAVLINRNHTYTDLVLPIDARQASMLAAIDGKRTIAEIAGHPSNLDVARDFFQQLWQYDQVVFDTTRAG